MGATVDAWRCTECGRPWAGSWQASHRNRGRRALTCSPACARARERRLMEAWRRPREVPERSPSAGRPRTGWTCGECGCGWEVAAERRRRLGLRVTDLWRTRTCSPACRKARVVRLYNEWLRRR